MKSQVKEISRRARKSEIGVRDTLAILDLTFEDHVEEGEDLHSLGILEGLDGLIDKTVHGTRIERFRPGEGSQPFHTFEIHTKTGDVLGHLNMVYLGKPIPCYYLVYAEVLSHFRGRGLGHNILRAFRDFAEKEKAVALLDNIIPPHDPAYTIYQKLGWRPVERLIGQGTLGGGGHYMVYVPPFFKSSDLRSDLIKVLLKVRKKRPILDMFDNESMVKRTIGEFQAAYRTLESLFAKELAASTSTPLMSFMFTKFVTKVLGFKRRISLLLGYTGGESLEQIIISDAIKALPIQPFSLWADKEDHVKIWGDKELIQTFPAALTNDPTAFVETLPVYKRPYLFSWMERKRRNRHMSLTISHLLELGFDPTKLREFHHEGKAFIFERISAGYVPLIRRKAKFLPRVEMQTSRERFRFAMARINPPLAILQNRGNSYVLRAKLDAIHLDEALSQLRTSSSALKEESRTAGVERTVLATVNEVTNRLSEIFPRHRQDIEDLVFFVPWDLETNRPQVMVDISGVFLDTIWLS